MNWIAEHPKREAMMSAFERIPAEHAAQLLDYAGGNAEFALWLAMVDRHLSRMIGLSHSDLADFNSRDLFDSGTSPSEGARECLDNDDTYRYFVGADL